jgi:hypothetical protein
MSGSSSFARHNQAAFETWSGRTGQLWAACSTRFDRLMGRITPHLIEAAAIEPSASRLAASFG